MANPLPELTPPPRHLDLSDSSAVGRGALSRFLQSIDGGHPAADLQRSAKLFGREMRNLNRKLASERDRLRLVFDAAPVGIIRIELDGRATMSNPAFQRMLGYTEGEILGLNPLELIHPDERAIASASINALRAGQLGDSYATQRKLLAKNGATVYGNISVSVASDVDGEKLFTIVVVEDISEKTRLEIELRHAQKLESVGRLAAGIAHELNTPIQFVGDNTEFLQTAFNDLLALCTCYRQTLDGLGAALGPDQRAALAQAEEAADFEYVREHAGSAFAATLDGVARVSKIVRAMRAFAHADDGHKTRADLNDAIRSTLTIGASELREIAIVETHLPELPPVECYLGDLNQVFLNLLVNAAHAVQDVVGDSGRKGKISIRTFRDGNSIVIAIADTGTGIPVTIRQRVFDPFFTTKEVGKGAGQGLAISRSLVEKHGGTLTFESEMGKGTTFFVRLPAGISCRSAEST